MSGRFTRTIYSNPKLRSKPTERYARTYSLPELRHRLNRAQAATHPAPSESQKKAGNYPKGIFRIKGIEISIENPVGSVRSGRSKDGKEWSVTMRNAYGYIKGVQGRDKDQLDIFIGPHLDSDVVFVVDQVNPKTGSFDEHKVMLGWKNKESAKQAYLDNHSIGWNGFSAITPITFDQFLAWIEHGDCTKRIATQVTEKYCRDWDSVERYAKKPAVGQGSLFREEDHPRGQPENAGEFAEKEGGGTHPASEKQNSGTPDGQHESWKDAAKAALSQLTLYRGFGSGKPNDHGVAGKGEYWTADEHVAKAYGPNVKSGKVELKNPLVATYGELNALQTKLYGKPLTGFEPELSVKFDQWMRENGYDGAMLYDFEISRDKPSEVVKLAETAPTEHYGRAPTGGIVSPVNGEEYKGGEFTPEHGEYCGKGKNRIAKKKLEAANADLENNRIVYDEKNEVFAWERFVTVGGEKQWQRATTSTNFATLAKAIGVKKEHYDRQSALKNPVGERHNAMKGKVAQAATGLKQWTEEEERKHPRGTGEKGGQFVSKAEGGGHPAQPAEESTTKPAQAPGNAPGGPPAKPDGKVSIGGRAFEIVKSDKGWLFRINDKAPWSKASAEAAVAIESRHAHEAAYNKARESHQKAAWSEVPAARHEHRRAKGIVQRLVQQILGLVDARAAGSQSGGSGPQDGPDPDYKALEEKERRWRDALNRKWMPLLAQTHGNYRQAVERRNVAKRTVEQIGEKLGKPRTRRGKEIVTDPDTGEKITQDQLTARQREKRKNDRKQLRINRIKAQLALPGERKRLKQEGITLTEDERLQLAILPPEEKLALIEQVRSNHQEAATAEKQRQSDRLNEERQRVIDEQRQAEEEKQRQQQARKQQEEAGTNAVKAMAGEHGLTPEEVRQEAEKVRPSFGTSTGANLALPDWHDPRVLEKTKQVLQKRRGETGAEANAVAERLQREEDAEAERQRKRNAPWVSKHGKEWSDKVWQATEARLKAGHSIEVTDGNDFWTIGPRNRGHLKLNPDGNVMLQRQGKWRELGDNGLEALGQQVGVEVPKKPGKPEEQEEDVIPFKRQSAVEHYSRQMASYLESRKGQGLQP